jgi:hypothetical protein
MMKNILLSLFSIAVFLLVTEITLRYAGYEPWKPIPIEDDVVYKPTPPFAPDTALGYKMIPGSCEISYGGEYTFTINTDSNGYRFTSKESEKHANKRKIKIFGDSFTQGSGLNDHETYPYLLQDSLENFSINNYGVSGYGVANIHRLICDFEKPDSGDIYVYAYFFQHNNRFERRVLKMAYAQPQIMGSLGYIILDEKNGKIQSRYQPYNYKMFFISKYSAIANLAEDAFNNFFDGKDNSKYFSIAYKAIRDMDEICKERGATFILAGIQREDGTEKMINRCKDSGIKCVDISVDLNLNEYNQMPYDNHPNAYSNRLFANRLLNYFRDNSLINDF